MTARKCRHEGGRLPAQTAAAPRMLMSDRACAAKPITNIKNECPLWRRAADTCQLEQHDGLTMEQIYPADIDRVRAINRTILTPALSAISAKRLAPKPTSRTHSLRKPSSLHSIAFQKRSAKTRYPEWLSSSVFGILYHWNPKLKSCFWCGTNL